MSHFTVLVRLPASVAADGLSDAVAKALARYEERDGIPDGDQKWDWYSIGGRWTGRLLYAKPGTEYGHGRPGIFTGPATDKTRPDWCRIVDLDWDRIVPEMHTRAETFWNEWQQFCDGKTWPSFEGPRDEAVDLGLITCADADQLTGKEWKTIKWSRQIRDGIDRYDVLKQIDRAEFLTEATAEFFPIKPYAYVGVDGSWTAPGEMGWFGMSSDTPEARVRFRGHFMDWLRDGDQQDWLVAVDCHI